MSAMDWMRTPIVQAAGWTLIHFLWQGSAIALATAAVLAAARVASAQVRYLVACAGLVAMLVAPATTARKVWSNLSVPPDASDVSRTLQPGDSDVARTLE